MSTNENEIAERLVDEDKEESPFSFLNSMSGSPGGAEELDEDSPFSFLRDIEPHLTEPEPVVPATGRFLEGTVKGIIHPIRAFLDPEEGEDLGLAGTFGEFTGAAVTFLPLFRGASAVLGGVGLIKAGGALGARTTFLAPFGQTPLGVKAASVARGALAFAGFETFAGETVEEAPGRFVRGLAEGAAFEAVALKAALLWRARGRRWIPPTGPTTPSPRPPATDAPLHPFALKFEYAWRPDIGDSMELIAAKTRLVGTPQEQLHQSFLTLMKNHMPGGQAIIPDLSRREVTQLFKKVDEIGNMTLAPFRKIRGEDAFDVLVVDMNRSLLTSEHLSGKATFEEVLSSIQQRFDDLVIELPKEIPPQFPAGDFAPTGLLGVGSTPRIRIATGTKKFEQGQGVSTLVHEFTHHLTFNRVARRGFGSKGSPSLDDIFDFSRVDPRVGRQLVREISVSELRRQMTVVTEEVITNYRILQGVALPRTRAKEFIQSNLSYFSDDVELIARMAELILVDPKRAKELAPMATRFVGGMIQQDAPVIRELMSREGKVVLDMFTDLWRMTGDDVTTVFTRGRLNPTPQMLKEYTRTGWAPGLRGLIDGKDITYLARLGKSQAMVRFPNTGVETVVDMVRLQRPILQTIARRNEEIIRAVDGVLDSPPSSMPVNLLDLAAGLEGGASGVRRAVVDLKDYAIGEGTVRDFVKNLPPASQESLIARFGQLLPMELDMMRGLGPAARAESEFLREALLSLGKKGLMLTDDGQMRIFVADLETVIKSPVLESRGFGAEIAGIAGDDVLIPTIDDFLKHTLRENGVSELDLDYFVRIAEERLGERLRAGVSTEVKQLDENVKVALKEAGGDTTDQIMSRSGVESDRLHDGSIQLRDADSKTILAILPDEDAAARYAMDLSADTGGPPLGKFPGASNNGGSGPPLKPNEQLFKADAPQGSKIADALTLGAPVISALENFAKAAERRGFGPVYTQIYVPAHSAMLQVQREMSDVARDVFGGLTFKDKFQQVSNKIIKVERKRYPTVTGHIEAVTREEIAKAGGLMTRAMTENELRIAKFIEGAGLGNDVPRLMSTSRLIDASVSGRLEKVIGDMKRIELSPEAQELLGLFESMPKIATREEAMALLDLSDAERQIIKIIKDSSAADKDKFSIYAVSRYASAPKLKKGFNNGKDQFAFENGMTKQELELSKLVSETLEGGFLESGLDPKRHLTGYWPHLRKWVQQGFVPDEDILPPDVLEWVATRFRSGELNVYETDPLSSVYRHIRGLFMKQHFDPVMPDINKVLRGVQDEGVGRVMREYMLELMGAPHASFGKLQGSIDKLFSILMGRKAPERLANDIISGLSAVTSSAVIPFRPDLIARNFFESVLKVLPRVGPNAYFRALRYVVSQETRGEAFNAAMKAGAIRPGTQKIRSLHSADELFGPAAPRAVHKYLRVFDKGFEWYQSADDWGRAIAYHGQRFRVMDNLDDYVKGRIGIETLKSRAKINTFDPLDAKIAEDFILDREYDKAIDHLGQVLSREAMTRYGYADHPVGWNSVQGRLFGQFGTWPVQYKDYLVQGMTRGSMRDRAEFGMLHAGVSGGIVAAGATIGLNLRNWTGMQIYTGGPFADLSIDVMKSISGSDLEKRMARRNLYSNIPILGWMETGNPRSLFVPGSYLVGDLNDAREALGNGDIFKGIMEGLGSRVMRPTDKNPLEFIYRF